MFKQGSIDLSLHTEKYILFQINIYILLLFLLHERRDTVKI